MVGMLMPGLFVGPLCADEVPTDGLVSASEAKLSLSLRQEVVDYLLTDDATMLVKSNHESGYLLTVENGEVAQANLFDLDGSLGDVQATNFSLTRLDDATEANNQVIISVIPVFHRPDKTMFEIEYMQEMTPEICDASTTPVAFLADGSINTKVPETQLIDARDGSVYTVRKLADGNCWMTENLRLNLSGRKLTSADTDIPEEVAITERKAVDEDQTLKFYDDVAPEPEDIESASGLGTAENPIRLDGSSADESVLDLVQTSVEERAARAKARAEADLWNEEQTTEEGMAIRKLTASEAMMRAGAANILSEKDARDVVTELLGAAKEEVIVKNVQNYTFTPSLSTQETPGARWGSSQPTEAETNVVHSQMGENAEYGNYYNWYAATVGTGTYYMGTKTASATICPRGWTLPHSEGANSFANLVDYYRLNEDATDLSYKDFMTSTPVSFVLSGVYYYNGLIGGQGEWGDYWTADVSNLVAANFDIETASQNFNHKTMGFSVRCIVKD